MLSLWIITKGGGGLKTIRVGGGLKTIRVVGRQGEDGAYGSD